MTDSQLRKYILSHEQFFEPVGDVYAELLDAGYPQEKIQKYIEEKRKAASASFKAGTLFFSIIFIILGILFITGYFEPSTVKTIIGFLLFIPP